MITKIRSLFSFFVRCDYCYERLLRR